MSRDEQDDEQTDVHVEIDATAVRADEVTRENVWTLPAPPKPPTAFDDEEEKTTLNAESRLRKVIVSLPSEPPLEETQSRDDLRLKRERTAMDVPPTVPVGFVPDSLPYQGRHRDLAEPPATVRIVSNAAGQAIVTPVVGSGVQTAPLPQLATVTTRANAPTIHLSPQVRSSRRAPWIALVLLLAVVVAGAIQREAVMTFARGVASRLQHR